MDSQILMCIFLGVIAAVIDSAAIGYFYYKYTIHRNLMDAALKKTPLTIGDVSFKVTVVKE